METKHIGLQQVEFKFAGEGMYFAGYASVFDGVDSYGDTIAQGAYTKTLEDRARPIRMRWNHFGPVIGKWLNISQDSKGLWAEGELTPGHSTAVDVYASMKHGAIDGMSIGYIPVKSSPIEDNRRLLQEIDLVEISVVEEPADLGARIGSIKSALDTCNSLKEIEGLLREAARLSKADATALVGRIKRIALGDQGAPDPEEKLKQFLQEQTLKAILARN
jgi:HK97 family phage prohead protease